MDFKFRTAAPLWSSISIAGSFPVVFILNYSNLLRLMVNVYGLWAFLAPFHVMYSRLSLSILKEEIWSLEFEWHALPPNSQDSKPGYYG